MRARNYLDLTFVPLASGVNAGLGDHDDTWPGLAFPRVEPKIPRSAGDDGSDVPFLDVVASTRLEADPRDFILCMRNLQVDCFRALEQTVHVPLELEDPAVVRADPFEDPIPVQESMVEDTDL